MKIYLILSFFFFCMSCNMALFVPQKDVIRNQKGYIVFYYQGEEALFFPWKDTVDNQFLGRNHLDGYKINNGERDLEYLKELAIDQIVTKNVLQNGKAIQVDETVKLIPVNIRYFWGEGWQLKKIKGKEQKVNIKYTFLNRDVDLIYRIYNDRQIMSITPTRVSDKVRVKEVEPVDLKN
ncbi:hypothetical protein PV783_21320 [Chitinophaga sp. CC14]|uniref:hypothetical protein n=1 Tax=Chitinophaga sp. CC14 TaxID=3029199 RepID=UPI003B78CCAB